MKATLPTSYPASRKVRAKRPSDGRTLASGQVRLMREKHSFGLQFARRHLNQRDLNQPRSGSG